MPRESALCMCHPLVFSIVHSTTNATIDLQTLSPLPLEETLHPSAVTAHCPQRPAGTRRQRAPLNATGLELNGTGQGLFLKHSHGPEDTARCGREPGLWSHPARALHFLASRARASSATLPGLSLLAWVVDVRVLGKCLEQRGGTAGTPLASALIISADSSRRQPRPQVSSGRPSALDSRCGRRASFLRL